MILTRLLAAFIIIPLVELIILMKLSERVGWMETLAIVVLTGIVGATLAKAQGLLVVRHIQLDLAEGRLPAPRLMDGVMILVAGALLITPGLLTDAAGFLLLVPGMRAAVRMWLKRRFEDHLHRGGFHGGQSGF